MPMATCSRCSMSVRRTCTGCCRSTSPARRKSPSITCRRPRQHRPPPREQRNEPHPSTSPGRLYGHPVGLRQRAGRRACGQRLPRHATGAGPGPTTERADAGHPAPGQRPRGDQRAPRRPAAGDRTAGGAPWWRDGSAQAGRARRSHRQPAEQGCGGQDRAADCRSRRSVWWFAGCLRRVGRERGRHHGDHAQTAAGPGPAGRGGAPAGFQCRRIAARQGAGGRRPAPAAEPAHRGVFGEGAYGHSRNGTPDSIGRITRADVQQLHGELYRPDNAILILTGDISAAQAQQLAQASFGDWQKPATPLPSRPAGRTASRLPSILLIDQHGAGQAGVVAAHAAPPRNDADYYVGTVANAVLGGSYSARLNEEIRIKRGLSYGASSRLQSLGDAGIWLASAQTKNPSAPQVVELMLGQFKQLGSTRVSADELAARKATLIGGYGRSLETTAGLANQVAELAIYGVRLDEIGKYIAQVQAVTPKQIEKYARKHLDGDDSHVVVVGDAAQFGAAIRQQHPRAVLLESTALDLDSPSLQAPPASR